MMDMGYPLHLIDLLAKLYKKELAKVKVAGTLSEWFRVKKGVRQGYVLSPYCSTSMPGARRRGRPRTAWMDNIKTWTGLSVEESIRMTEDRDKWRKYVDGAANPRIEDS